MRHIVSSFHDFMECNLISDPLSKIRLRMGCATNTPPRKEVKLQGRLPPRHRQGRPLTFICIALGVLPLLLLALRPLVTNCKERWKITTAQRSARQTKGLRASRVVFALVRPALFGGKEFEGYHLVIARFSSGCVVAVDGCLVMDPGVGQRIVPGHVKHSLAGFFFR